jgi:immune inhibitor A
MGNRRQPFDATFGLHRTTAVTFHHNGVALNVPAQAPISVFDDTNPLKYWSTANPLGSVQVAGAGTKIRVVSELPVLDMIVIAVTN